MTEQEQEQAWELLGRVWGETLLDAIRRRMKHLQGELDERQALREALGDHARPGDTLLETVQRLVTRVTSTSDKDPTPEMVGDLSPLEVLIPSPQGLGRSPLLFTSITGAGSMVLVYLAGQAEGVDQHIVAPMDPHRLQDLMDGRIDIHSALTGAWMWRVSRDAHGSNVAVYLDGVPSHLKIPPPGERLPPREGQNRQLAYARDHALLRLVRLHLGCAEGRELQAIHELQEVLNGTRTALRVAGAAEIPNDRLVGVIYARVKELKAAQKAHKDAQADMEALMDALQVPGQVSATRWAATLLTELQDLSGQLTRSRLRLRALGCSET